MAKHANHKLKKGLGQHFLKDEEVLLKIYNVIQEHASSMNLLEIGPGAGALSKYLVDSENYKLVEFDQRWVHHLEQEYPKLKGRIINEDILRIDLSTVFKENIAFVGNFPYNISSQILFKVIDNRESVPLLIGMFQKEVAKRVCAGPGSKIYGVTSVLLQAFYDLEYLFDVPREAFNPPPKVISGVLIMRRKEGYTLPCNYKLMRQIVKAAFNQRRKMLRSGLKPFINPKIKDLEVFSQRPEQLSVDAFINLTNIIESTQE